MSRLGFTNEDYFNLFVIYVESEKVITRAVRIFRERFPNRPRPTFDTVSRMINNLKNEGSFTMITKRNSRPVTEDEENQIMVLAYFAAHPTASINDCQRNVGLGRSTIWKILHNHKYKPYSIMLVQHLKEVDFEKRVLFCESMLLRIQEEPDFLQRMIWSDEAKFTKNGIYNKHNSHYWSNINTNEIREVRFQEVWQFNVYCAIKNDEVLVVHIYDENLTSEKEKYGIHI